MIGLLNLRTVCLINTMVALLAFIIPPQRAQAQTLNFVKRDGENWILQNQHLTVHLFPASGSIEVQLNDSKKTFRQEKGTAPFRAVKPLDSPQKGVEFQWSPLGKPEQVFKEVKREVKDWMQIRNSKKSK